MMNLNRRTFIGSLLAAGAATAMTGFTPRFARAQAAGGRIGRLFTLDKGAIKVHTYIAPDASLSVTSHLIETPNSLVIVDAQFVQTFAGEVRAIADAVGKPVERLILSHAHPDHFLGANLFDGTPFVTTDGIAAELAAYIEAGSVAQVAAVVGESEVPPEVRPAEGGITLGSETIDGVEFGFELVENAEATQTLVIRIPEAGVIVVQDLVYNNMHFFPGADRDNWIAALDTLRTTTEGFDTFLVGHGLPTTRGELDSALDYLRFVQAVAADAASGDEIIEAVTMAYPSYEGLGILPFWNVFFQPQ